MTNYYSFIEDSQETFSEQQIEEISKTISSAVETVIWEQFSALSDSAKKKARKSSSTVAGCTS